ncbi:MgtC/SapB family protein [Candidatus Micrarchaeota archaeon]|nr:MgtC/SapB family protein [Candidatus Micrarchaeota archaeon]
MLVDGEIILRFVVAVVIGLLIGLARRHKPAGIRTFTLLCFGSAIFTVISVAGPFTTSAAYDPTRVIAQIVAGIGFLGLGVIWKEGLDKPSGLTTAAAIWVTAGLGILVGLGMWVETLAATVFTLAILYSKKPLTLAHLEE